MPICVQKVKTVAEGFLVDDLWHWEIRRSKMCALWWLSVCYLKEMVDFCQVDKTGAAKAKISPILTRRQLDDFKN
jgi:hypothetical protein